jgi:antitoxin component HigA of HigAB toxin-antitoxin module
MKLKDKLQKLSTPPSSDWVEESGKKLAEEGAKRHARKVALVVLEALDKQSLTQQALADRMGVSRQQVTKIVKGKENLTFETIAKLENALKMEILSIKALKQL